MSERAILVSGFMALPDGWPTKAEMHRDLLLVSDGKHVVGSRPFPGGHGLVGRAADGVWHSFAYHAVAVRADDTVHVAPFVIGRDGFDLAETPSIPAPFDLFRVGGERLPDLAEA